MSRKFMHRRLTGWVGLIQEGFGIDLSDAFIEGGWGKTGRNLTLRGTL
jgi:hypothetical protein